MMTAAGSAPEPPDGRAYHPPRVVSELKKKTISDPVRPRIAGDLLLLIPENGYGNVPRWCPRRVLVRTGHLIITGHNPIRVPLRQLSLAAGPHHWSFCLRRRYDAAPLVTLRASSEEECEHWLRAIAIELLRQTPLAAVRYLDILPAPKAANCCSCDKCTVMTLAQRCHSADALHQVSVHDKRQLFESLCRLSVAPPSPPLQSRAQSLLDLNNPAGGAVRQICRYFEGRKTQEMGQAL